MDKVAILDCGGQYTKVIDRRVRKLNETLTNGLYDPSSRGDLVQARCGSEIFGDDVVDHQCRVERAHRGSVANHQVVAVGEVEGTGQLHLQQCRR